MNNAPPPPWIFGDGPKMMGSTIVGRLGRGKHQERVRKSAEKEPWAQDDQRVRQLLEKVFPNLHTNPTDHNRAGKWMFIITKFFRYGETASRVAAEILNRKAKEEKRIPSSTEFRLELKKVERAIKRIRLAAAGLRTDGRKATGRKRGRPKKMA